MDRAFLWPRLINVWLEALESSTQVKGYPRQSDVECMDILSLSLKKIPLLKLISKLKKWSHIEFLVLAYNFF